MNIYECIIINRRPYIPLTCFFVCSIRYWWCIYVGHQGAALLATLFDVGGIAGTQNIQCLTFNTACQQGDVHFYRQKLLYLRACVCQHSCLSRLYQLLFPCMNICIACAQFVCQLIHVCDSVHAISMLHKGSIATVLLELYQISWEFMLYLVCWWHIWLFPQWVYM